MVDLVDREKYSKKLNNSIKEFNRIVLFLKDQKELSKSNENSLKLSGRMIIEGLIYFGQKPFEKPSNTTKFIKNIDIFESEFKWAKINDANHFKTEYNKSLFSYMQDIYFCYKQIIKNSNNLRQLDIEELIKYDEDLVLGTSTWEKDIAFENKLKNYDCVIIKANYKWPLNEYEIAYEKKDIYKKYSIISSLRKLYMRTHTITSKQQEKTFMLTGRKKMNLDIF